VRLTLARYARRVDGHLLVSLGAWGAAALLTIVVARNVLRRKRGSQVRRGPGPGAAGAVYGMLNEDKRRAIEIVAEGRAEQTDPEHADGLPQTGRRHSHLIPK
jgi:hypothetical protein